MKKKWTVIAVTAISIIVSIYFAFPKVAIWYFQGEALRRGWAVSAKNARINTDGVSFSEVTASRLNGSSANFREVSVNFEATTITVSDGTAHIIRNGSSGGSEKKIVVISNVEVQIDGICGGEVTARIDSARGRDEVKASNVSAECSWGSAQVDNIVVSGKSIHISSFEAALKSRELKNNGSGTMTVLDFNVSLDRAKVKTEWATIAAEKLNIDGKLAKAEFVNVESDSTPGIRMSSVQASYSNGVISIKADEVAGRQSSISESDMVFKSVEASIWREDKAWKSKVKAGQAIVDLSVEKNGEAWFTSVKADSIQCQSVLEAVPNEVKGKLNGFIFDGEFSIEATVVADKKNPKASIKFLNKCISKTVPDGMRREDLRGKFSRTVTDSNGNDVQLDSGPRSLGWVPLGSVSRWMPLAVITTEDPGFTGHRGFDVLAIENSIVADVKAGKFARGASTLTMQLAKNLWLTRSKTLSRKFQEAFLTTHLEQILSKEEIMETYLNVVEFAPGIYGIGAASKKYFGTSPEGLTLTQCLFLSLMLPNPKANVVSADGRVEKGRMGLIRAMVANMVKSKKATEADAEEADAEWVVVGKDKPERVPGSPIVATENGIDPNWLWIE